MQSLKMLAVVVALVGVAALGSGWAQPPGKPGKAPAGKTPTANPAPDRYVLRLGEQSFDPVAAEPVLPAGWNVVEGRDDVDDLHLVQFTGPTQARWLDELQAAGFSVIQYIHPFTYIVWGKAANRAGVPDQVEQVRWTGAFAPAYRVLPQWRNLPADLINVDVMLVRSADTNAAVQGILDAGGGGARLTSRDAINDTFEIATFLMPGNIFQQVAQIPGVYSIQPLATNGGLRGEMSDQINVGNYNGSNQAFPGYAAWLTSVGFNGTGVKIANVDGGVQDTHPNLAARMAPCVGSTCGGATQSSHGTHTAGIMAADNTTGVLDAFGFARGLGVAPGANLVEQLYSPTYTQANGMLLLMTQSAANGASLSGNSWGPSGTPLGYDNKTLQCDIGVRDTDAAISGDQPLSFVLSIMNGNGGTSTQGTPDEGKNLFTIGSTKMQNSGSGSQILQIDDLSSNSAHGPCLDGRKIPHLVAPGCNVDSTYTTSTYSLLCGTSMASPHVSGAVAMFIQYYRSLPGYTVDPSPALVKAAFLPVAYDLAGHLDADGGILGHPFDSKQGWGRMNLRAVVSPPANSTRYFDNPVVFDNTGEQWTTALSPIDGGQPMRIMLVWTDAPGHGLGGSTPAWNNNLNLAVDAGSGTYLGNVFGANGYSTTGGVADDRNNTEGVFLPAGSGPVTIRVVAANINSNGLPNSGDATDQDFALVVYNAAVEPGFMLSANPASQTVCAPATPSYSVNVGQILGFSDPVTLSVSALPSGVTGGFAANPVTPPASTTLDLNVAANAAPGSWPLQITGTSGTITRTANITLNLSNAIPAAPALTSPANGAVNVPVTPTLSWGAVAQAASYDIQISNSNSFGTIVYSATDSATSHAVATALGTNTVYYWRVRASNICGIGQWSAAFSFRTLDVPAILLVDDDDNGPDVRSYYTAALTSLGMPFDVWDTANSASEPTAAQIAPYRIIIWFSGDAFGGTSAPKAGPTAATETVLQAWLDAGGCFFLSSQDYLWDRIGSGVTTPNAFMQNYLGMAAPIGHDVTQTSVTGLNVFNGYGPYTLTYPFSNYSDRVTPTASALQAFNGNAGGAAVTKDAAPAYRSSFWGFPLEAVPDAASRMALMNKIVTWCGELNLPCPPDITGDGQVDINDLLAVINEWGPCPAPPIPCPADVTADGQIDVNDLLAVIGGWGPCP